MQSSLRGLRMLVYRLKDVEDAVRAAKMPDAADELARAGRLFGKSSNEDFLDESRVLLINFLLGERALSSDLMGQVLEMVALIDDAFVALRDSGESNL
jgi:hypothetical protein